jgi:ATPases involved in chromosome partitioning
VQHYELEHTVHNLLVEPRVSIDDVLIHTRVPGMDLAPSNIDLSAAEIQLVNEVGREQSWPARCIRCSTATTMC